MRSGEEIRRALVAFVQRWQGYQGSERGEAQTFLNELFEAYGRDRKDAGAVFEDAHSSVGIMDLHLPGAAIIEMKAPREAERLELHRRQALDYWTYSADAAEDRAAPSYVVLCAFHRFEVWEPGRFPTQPRLTFPLAELPDRYEALQFLAGPTEEPLFLQTSRTLTAEAATAVADVDRRLRDREAAKDPVIRSFLLRLVWLFFAEDFAMLNGRPTEAILKFLSEQDHWTSHLLLGGLFGALDDEDIDIPHGVLRGVTYVNGSLFAGRALVHLTRDEAASLHDIARYDWRQVDPTIFGAMLEGFLGDEARGNLGIHYTHEADIMKIVRPTIVRPWRERIDAVASVGEAVALLEELCRFRVLDPACGCGNFLYIAYRELRALEAELKRVITDLARRSGVPVPDSLPFYPLCNLHGIDIVNSAVELTRVTLWMGHRQMIDRYGPAEPPLPLVDLPTIVHGDALKVDWPEVDCVIGNPPFLGSQHLREVHGDDYLTWLGDEFGVGLKDYCVYWFRKAQDHLAPGQRAGLVGTNSVAQNRARSASLEYVTGNGGVITDAVPTQVWPGEAKVHVSLVNWVNTPAEPPSRFTLNGVEVSGITADLRTPETSAGKAQVLPANKGRCFQGMTLVGSGFIITDEEAHLLLRQSDAEYRDVVHRFLTGEDIADDPQQRPRRWIVDFGQRPLEVAMKYPAALEVVRNRVKPVRAKNKDRYRREHWWLLGRPYTAVRDAIANLSRYIASNRVGK